MTDTYEIAIERYERNPYHRVEPYKVDWLEIRSGLCVYVRFRCRQALSASTQSILWVHVVAPNMFLVRMPVVNVTPNAKLVASLQDDVYCDGVVANECDTLPNSSGAVRAIHLRRAEPRRLLRARSPPAPLFRVMLVLWYANPSVGLGRPAQPHHRMWSLVCT